MVNSHVSWHFPTIDSHHWFNLSECFGLTYTDSTGRQNATETRTKRTPIDQPSPKNKAGAPQWQRGERKSQRLLINGDLEFLCRGSMHHAFLLWSNDLLDVSACDAREESTDIMSGGKSLSFLLVVLFCLVVNCLLFFCCWTQISVCQALVMCLPPFLNLITNL